MKNKYKINIKILLVFRYVLILSIRRLLHDRRLVHILYKMIYMGKTLEYVTVTKKTIQGPSSQCNLYKTKERYLCSLIIYYLC